MNEMTIRAIMKLLVDAKRDYLKTVKELKSRIRNIEECQNTLGRLAEMEKEPYYKDMFKCSKEMLGEYKALLLDMIENTELD